MASTSALQRHNPRPVPCLKLFPTNWYFWNKFSRIRSGIPGPESSTVKTIYSSDCLKAVKLMNPFSTNLLAFFPRFSKTCFRRNASTFRYIFGGQLIFIATEDECLYSKCLISWRTSSFMLTGFSSSSSDPPTLVALLKSSMLFSSSWIYCRLELIKSKSWVIPFRISGDEFANSIFKAEETKFKAANATDRGFLTSCDKKSLRSFSASARVLSAAIIPAASTVALFLAFKDTVLFWSIIK
mmetsp:Transcript_15130/g.19469  ORF Transcript_15130/g.19469 Transcript_15130/m.19469 type:complete len:241 (-) Transcript_15130:1174-1896(-)